MKFIAALSVVSVLVWPVLCQAATLEVKPDGSKEYRVLQDALSAAVTGDTVLVHAGVYRKWTERFHGGQVRRAVGFIESGVTITTTGLNAIIQPPDLTLSMGLYSVTSESVVISGLRVEGSRRSTGMIVGISTSTVVRNCRFKGLSWGVLAGGDGYPCVITECLFEDSGGVGVGSLSQVLVRECLFAGTDPPIGSALVVSGLGSGELRSCTVDRLAGVIQVNNGGSALADSVTATNILVGGLVRDPGSRLIVRNTELTGATIDDRDTAGLIVKLGGVLEARNVSLNGMVRSLFLDRADSVTINESRILDWGEWAVWMEQAIDPPLRVFDLTKNSWSGADSASIAASIWDGNDDPINNAYGFVEFWPTKDPQVSLPAKSMGRMKGRY